MFLHFHNKEPFIIRYKPLSHLISCHFRHCSYTKILFSPCFLPFLLPTVSSVIESPLLPLFPTYLVLRPPLRCHRLQEASLSHSILPDPPTAIPPCPRMSPSSTSISSPGLRGPWAKRPWVSHLRHLRHFTRFLQYNGGSLNDPPMVSKHKPLLPQEGAILVVRPGSNPPGSWNTPQKPTNLGAQAWV